MGIFSNFFKRLKEDFNDEVEKKKNTNNLNKAVAVESRIDDDYEMEESEDDEDLEPDDEFRVVNTKFSNEDGSSRKEILSKCMKNEIITIKAVLLKTIPTIEVWTKHGMIGHISKGPAQYVYPLAKSGEYIGGKIISMTLGTPDKPRIKCRIKLNRKLT